MDKPINAAIFVIVAVIAIVIAITALMSQAPTVAISTSTASGSALANAGITSNTLAGLVYSFINVLWALLPFVVIAGAILGFYAIFKGGTGKHK